MYENLIRQPSTARSPKQPFSIRLDPIPVHEKAAYINSVFACLTDSRFGPGRSRQMWIDLRKSKERDSAVFCEMTIDGPVPFYEILPDSVMARRYIEEAIRRELAQTNPVVVTIHVQPLPTPNLGRGSPQLSQGRKRKSGGKTRPPDCTTLS